MFTDNNLYISQFQDIVRRGQAQISTIKPSEWTEKRVIMGKPRPGPFRYDYTPYAREIIDCLAPDHPARKVAFMKGAQIGISSGVFYPGIGWMIENNPGNTYLMVGTATLVEAASAKLDLLIHNAGLKDYIKPQVQKKRNQKTGDTNTRKDFAGGYVFIGSADNHKSIAQVDLEKVFLDDLDAMKGASTQAGDMLSLFEQRVAAYKNTYKLFMVSTPLLKESSIIEPAYLLGDQRKYFVKCPCCDKHIIFKWEVLEGEVINKLENDIAEYRGGIVYEVDRDDVVIEETVGYTCYKCSGFFTDRDKLSMLQKGQWRPTAIPSEKGYYSYHLPSLYAPPGMFGWFESAKRYEVACPRNGKPRNEKKYQTFCNVVLGETYATPATTPKATDIMGNIQRYEVGVVPERLSLQQGNGKIVMLTCGADMNGVENDGRLDYEIVAHTENGSTYSVTHGSIGTFIPRENAKTYKVDRERWTYGTSKHNNIWREFEKVLSTPFVIDEEIPDGAVMRQKSTIKVTVTALDCGHLDKFAFSFLDQTNHTVIGVKGEKEAEWLKWGIEKSRFKLSSTRNDMYMLQVGLYKDINSDYMALKWNKNDAQPANFMNFPQPGDGLYNYDNYFSHFEAEERRAVTDAKSGKTVFRWEKKASNSQNHIYDCRIYNLAAVEIFMQTVAFQHNIKLATWADFCKLWREAGMM